MPAPTPVPCQQPIHVQRVTRDEKAARKSLAKMLRKFRGFFDGDKSIFREALFEQGFGHGSRARTEFKHIGVRVFRQPAGHGRREVARTGHDGTHLARLAENFAQKKGGVV